MIKLLDKKKMKQEIHFYIFRPLYTLLESEFPHLSYLEEIRCKEFEVYFSNTSIDPVGTFSDRTNSTAL